jgi:hypothetical protein
MKRTLKYLTWEDPLAWTESMRGPAWNRLLKQEESLYKSVLAKYTRPEEVQRIADELTVAGQAQKSEPFSVVGKLQIWNLGTFSKIWKWTTTGPEHDCADCIPDRDGNMWEVLDTGEGAETYTLRYWPFQAEKPLWEVQGVGPYVVVIGKDCYFLESQNSLWFCRFCCVNALTGKARQLLYEEKDPLWNLSLVRAENQTAYLVREDSGLQQAFFFHNPRSLQALPITGFFVLGGGAPNDYLATEGRGTDDWKGYGPRVSRWRFPEGHGIPESLWVEHGLLVTRKQGERFLWKCSTREMPLLLHKGFCQISMNEWGIFFQEKTATFRIVEPGSFTTFCRFQNTSIVCLPPHIDRYGTCSRFEAGAVPFILVKPEKRPVKALLVTGYGAYGHPSSLDTTRWYPLLKRGWAVVVAMVRGGGDDTMAWADAARTWKRETAIADFEAVIRMAQKNLGVSAKNTMIYGRSAGGILIGAAAARQRATTLFGGLYGEVPYLDVLRTTTNANLPLTIMEFNEFGNPGERVEDLVALGKISPMEGIPAQGFPGLFALIRTGANDKEVFAYEPVKWILKARGPRKDPTKVLVFEEKEGHFVNGTAGIQHRAADLALLLAWNKVGLFRLA